MVELSASKTVGELSRETGAPEWLVRRIADSLDVTIPRIGPYRAITPDIESRILNELRRRGKLPQENSHAY